MEANGIIYAVETDLDLEETIDLYHASTLGERRPIDDRPRFAAMLKNANLILTARDTGLLVGIARSFTDKVYATYLADLAVRQSHQRQGIGKELIRRTQLEVPHSNIILLAAPKAVDYYPHIGFEKHNSAWMLKPGQ